MQSTESDTNILFIIIFITYKLLVQIIRIILLFDLLKIIIFPFASYNLYRNAISSVCHFYFLTMQNYEVTFEQK